VQHLALTTVSGLAGITSACVCCECGAALEPGFSECRVLRHPRSMTFVWIYITPDCISCVCVCVCVYCCSVGAWLTGVPSARFWCTQTMVQGAWTRILYTTLWTAVVMCLSVN